MKVAVELARRLPDPLLGALLHLRLNPLFRPSLDWCAARIKNTDAVIQRGVGKGLRFNPGESNASYLLGTAEMELQKVLQLWLRPGMIVYDIGANVGFLTVIAARLVGDNGRVFAFEPVPMLAEQAAHNVQLNHFKQVSVQHIALSDRDEEAVFQLSENLTMGKLVDREAHELANESQLLVRKRQLDGVIGALGLPDPDVAKIDVEGAEIQVLRGAVEALQRARPILLIELHGTEQGVAERLERMSFIGRLLVTRTSIPGSSPNRTLVAVPVERSSMLSQLADHGLVQ